MTVTNELVLYWLISQDILIRVNGEWMIGHQEDTPIDIPWAYSRKLDLIWHDVKEDELEQEKH